MSDDPAPASSAQDLPAGTLLGRHEIIRRISSGGMAIVYEGRHVDLQKRVAIKVMRSIFTGDASSVQRFVLEARAASRLVHPHVIAVTDVGVEHGLPFMVMDYLEGEDLFTTLAREGALPIERAADLLLPVISAVAAAHAEGILHRDLKPENIFITKTRQGRERPILLDFGISKVKQQQVPRDAQRLTRVGQTVGTPEFMAPEQVSGAADLDGRADQYALGVILYLAVTGEMPYAGATLAELFMAILKGGAPPPSYIRPVPPDFDAVVLRAIAASRDDRFPNARDLGRALWRFTSPFTQVMWAEEFGDGELTPRTLVTSLSSPPAAPSGSTPPARASQPSVAPSASTPPTRASQPSAAPPDRVSQPSLEVQARASQPKISAPVVAEAPRGERVTLKPSDFRRFPAFDECDDEDLQGLIARIRGMRHEKGSQIVAQGAHGHSCFLLVSGKVRVEKTVAGKSWVLAELGPGSVFGQIALVDHGPRTAEVRADERSVVAEIGRDAFEELLRDGGEAALRLYEELAIAGIRQLRLATKRFTTLMERGDDGRTLSGARRQLQYLRAAAREWALSLPEDER